MHPKVLVTLKVISAVPAPSPVTLPDASTEATEGEPLIQPVVKPVVGSVRGRVAPISMVVMPVGVAMPVGIGFMTTSTVSDSTVAEEPVQVVCRK